jgi:transposase
LGISKRGDAYLRTLLMHGVRAIIARRTYSDWVAGLIARRPYSVVIAAIANKLARTIWAVLANGKRYDRAAFAAAI